MNDFDFAAWDNEFDSELIQAEIAKAESNSGDYEEVPHGTYEVKIQKLELGQTKAGKPKLACWFKILAGEYKEQMIFMNQVIDPSTPNIMGFQLHKCNEFLRSLSSLPVSFESFKQYNLLLMDIMGEIDGKFEYQLNYSADKKGYNTFKIEKTFEAAPF